MSGSKKPPLYTGAEPPKHPNPLRPIQQILPQTHNRGQYIDATKAMQRPKAFNSTGAPAIVQINSFPILKYPTRTVHQYDVMIGSGAEKRGLIKEVWESSRVKAVCPPDQGWIFDGNRMAWSLVKIKPVNMIVDLDAERGIPPREGRSNNHRVQISPTATVRLDTLNDYLEGKCDYDNNVMVAISFLDHLLREEPSKRMYSIKRSFFARGMVDRTPLGGGIEALKGVYQSIRTAQGGKLVVNVDVSNSTFWGPWQMNLVAWQKTGAIDYPDLGAQACKKVQKTSQAPLTDHVYMIRLKQMRKLRFEVHHKGIDEKETNFKTWQVKEFSYKNAKEWKFDLKERATGKVSPSISIFDYFKRKYNITLQYFNLPIVETMKRGVAFPMEVCMIKAGQRYPFKLDDVQTSKMIKFAVTRPDKRREGIEGGLKMLDWDNDPNLLRYDLRIQPTMLETQARLLTPPQLEFGMKRYEKPGYSGRWRLDGKKFLNPNKYPLASWGVVIVNNMGRDHIDRLAAERFVSAFVSQYKGHGGQVIAPNPTIYPGHPDIANAVLEGFNLAGNHFRMRPQFMLFLAGGKEKFTYERLKKSTDCRFGVMSQVCQNQHVVRCQPQYLSNVLMKVNAKLGGVTNRAVPTNPKLAVGGHFTRPTMIIGADVSHASPGSVQASTAAVTVSMNPQCTRYAAACQTNGHRVEMITTANMLEMLTPIFREWMSTIGGGKLPQHIIYMRDGVSEGQHLKLLEQEVTDIRLCFSKLAEHKPELAKDIPFTVLVASKRHHIRFFPKGKPAADVNMNPCPGVLVEKDVTHTKEWDFYLNSHSAIQGTARPTHYHVLMDQAGMTANELQTMIYEQCYQYIRSTTPVSLHPAVYYAHLASNRSKCHEDMPSSAGPHKKTEELHLAQGLPARGRPSDMGSTSQSENWEIKPLLKMDNTTGIRWGMWFV